MIVDRSRLISAQNEKIQKTNRKKRVVDSSQIDTVFNSVDLKP